MTVTVVDVGQGQCTFVEIYDDTKPTPKLVHTILMDCGTDKASAVTDDNIDYIVKKIKSMDKPAIDCLVFSHSDKDHIWLMWDLLRKFEPTFPDIKTIWYGGDRDQYTKYGYNVLNYIESEKICKKANIKSPGSDRTGYDIKSKIFK